MKSIPQVLWFDTQASFVLDSFYCRKFVFLDPIHKLSWAAPLVCNFFNLVIKEGTFEFFDRAFEVLPVF